MRRIACVQYDVKLGKVEENLATASRLIAKLDAPHLVVLPELATSGYELRDRDELGAHSETYGDGPAATFARTWAETLSAGVVIGYAERQGGKFYNSSLLALPDGSLYNYRKLHLFSREKTLFEQGDCLSPIVETPAGKVGMMICFDWFFPEVARSLALAGTEIIAHPSNLVLPWCQRAMFTRSVENRVISATANRIGTDDHCGRKLIFTGGSQILDHTGDALAQCTTTQSESIWADTDVAATRSKRLNEFNDLFQDRRTDILKSF